MRKIVIAIDGYSACGKSTTAKEVAKVLGYKYIDSGAMYRAVTLYFLDNHVSLTNPKEIARALENIKLSFHVNEKGISEVCLDGISVEKKIRKMKISQSVSPVSAIKEVRHAMVEQQRTLGKSKGQQMHAPEI
jgi:CMP/dCMP kinase